MNNPSSPSSSSSLLGILFNTYPLLVSLALWIVCIGIGVAILVLCLSISSRVKQGRALAIVSGVANFAYCAVGAPVAAISNRDSMGMASEMIDILIDLLTGAISSETYLEKISGLQTTNLVWSLLTSAVGFVGLFAFVVTLIFLIRMLKLKPRALGISALVIFIVHQLFLPIGPSGISGLITIFASPAQGSVLATVINWVTGMLDVVTTGFSLLALTLSFVLVLIAAIKQRKAA